MVIIDDQGAPKVNGFPDDVQGAKIHDHQEPQRVIKTIELVQKDLLG